MEIGINRGAWHGLDAAEEFALLKKHGFTHFFADSHDRALDSVMTAAKDAGIICDTFHAPFRNINDMWLDNADGEKMFTVLKETVDTCEHYSVPVAIVHLSSGDFPPNINDTGINRFSALVDYAKNKDVRIAFENQRKLGNIAYAFEKCPDAVFCWDTGHEACFAYGLKFMPIFGKKLAALHIHDNFGEHNKDLHMLPFDASIDFDKAAEYIAGSGYNGTVMLEVFAKKTEKYAGFSPDEYYERAARAAQRIKNMIEQYK